MTHKVFFTIVFFKIISKITDLVRILISSLVLFLFQQSCRYTYLCANTWLSFRDLVSGMCIAEHQVKLGIINLSKITNENSLHFAVFPPDQ